MSVVFDTTDHAVLICQPQTSWVGIAGVALKWFTIKFSNIKFNVVTDDGASPLVPLNCEVPQGSVLGPVLFLLYLLPLSQLTQGFSYWFYHCYAADTQINMSIKPDDSTIISVLYPKIINFS